MRPLTISTGEAANFAAITRTTQVAWDKFVAYLRARPKELEDKAQAGWYCPAEFKPAYRDGKNLVARHALTFDYDQIEKADLDLIRVAYADLEYVMHTTASHTEEKPRVRVVFPLNRPATADEFGAVTRKIGARFDLDKLARESDKPAQMMFRLSVKPGGDFWGVHNVGKWVDVDKVLGEYDDWRDRSQWPRRSSGDDSLGGDGVVVPPDEKLGIVGDFCRAYRIPDVIEKFALPYEPGSNDTRWSYSLGSRPDGLRLYDGALKAHCEDNTDPAHGQHNAFDLVRLHRYGDLDGESDRQKPITERPSYRAMCKLALEQPEVQQLRVEGEFENLDAATTTSVEAEGRVQPVLAVPVETLIENPTKPRWLLRDRLERGVIALMAGPRGAYKSFIALDWAMRSLEHGPVYVLSAEGADFDRRARAWMLAHDYKKENCGLFVAQQRLDLNVHDNIELVRQDCVKTLGVRPVLFVLDTFSKLSGALDENSNTDVKAFIGRLDNGLKRAFDATVLLIAHTGHGEKTRARGASALEADTDAAYVVRRQDELVLLTRERFKSSPELEPLAMQPEIVSLGYMDDDGVPVSSIVMRPAELPKTGLVRAEPTGLYPKNVLVTARELAKMGDEIEVEALVQAAVDKITRPEGKRDTRKQSAARAVQKLIVDGWLFKHSENTVSITSAKAADGEWTDG